MDRRIDKREMDGWTNRQANERLMDGGIVDDGWMDRQKN